MYWPALLHTLEGGPSTVNSIAFSPEGKYIVSGSYYGTILVWDAQTGDVILGPYKGQTSHVHSVAFSPDGKRIASGTRDRTIRVWGTESGNLVAGPF